MAKPQACLEQCCDWVGLENLLPARCQMLGLNNPLKHCEPIKNLPTEGFLDDRMCQLAYLPAVVALGVPDMGLLSAGVGARAALYALLGQLRSLTR